MVVLTPKLGVSIPLHSKFLLMKYFKSSNYGKKNSVMIANRSQWLESDSCRVKKNQVFTPSLVFKTHNIIRSLYP